MSSLSFRALASLGGEESAFLHAWVEQGVAPCRFGALTPPGRCPSTSLRAGLGARRDIVYPPSLVAPTTRLSQVRRGDPSGSPFCGPKESGL